MILMIDQVFHEIPLLKIDVDQPDLKFVGKMGGFGYHLNIQYWLSNSCWCSWLYHECFISYIFDLEILLLIFTNCNFLTVLWIEKKSTWLFCTTLVNIPSHYSQLHTELLAEALFKVTDTNLAYFSSFNT